MIHQLNRCLIDIHGGLLLVKTDHTDVDNRQKTTRAHPPTHIFYINLNRSLCIATSAVWAHWPVTHWPARPIFMTSSSSSSSSGTSTYPLDDVRYDHHVCYCITTPHRQTTVAVCNRMNYTFITLSGQWESRLSAVVIRKRTTVYTQWTKCHQTTYNCRHQWYNEIRVMTISVIAFV